MTDALTTLFFLGVSGTALGLLLMLLRRTAGKRLPGVFYHLAWLVVLLRFVVPLPGLVPVRSASAPAYIASSTEGAAPSARHSPSPASAAMKISSALRGIPARRMRMP